MQRTKLIPALVGAGALLIGLGFGLPWLWLPGAIVVGVVAALHFRQKPLTGDSTTKVDNSNSHVANSGNSQAEFEPPRLEEGEDTNSLVKRLTQQKRYALLVRPQVACTLEDRHLETARDVLDEEMSIVPSGDVFVDEPDFEEPSEHSVEKPPTLVHVESIHLDRFQVTNADFQLFVNDGGYEQVSFWDPTIWPAVLEFVDQTGYPGPRYWENGSFPKGEATLPVVGISWYEAQAYSHWVGKRLPTSAEWVKAGAWPVSASGNEPIQRRYPWGDTMDRKFANLWGGPGDAVAVDQFEEGVSVGGIHQLVGNVWEWTQSDFVLADKQLVFNAPLKTIHGGAYDTYFDGHATCQFRSGESPLSRKKNIGFRCAIGVCDIVSNYTHVQDEVVDEEDAVLCGYEED